MHVLAEGKMRCLFSLVFGASVILLTSRLETRPDAADIYYRRTLWLLLFGIVHAFLLWEGDILYPYALCGLALYPFRKLRAKTLIIAGSVLLLLNAAAYIGLGFSHRFGPLEWCWRSLTYWKRQPMRRAERNVMQMA